MNVGTLIFEMSANIARLQGDMRQAKETVVEATETIKGAVEGAKRALETLGIGLGVHELKEFALGAIESQNALFELSERTGVAATELAALRGIARQSGTDMDSVATGVQKLDKAMLAAATTGKGPAADAFQRLGIEVLGANGQLRSGEEVMKEVGERLAAMGNQTQAVAFAQEIFGKSGANLLPFLRQLAESSDLVTKRTEEEIRAAHEFSVELAKLKQNSQEASETLVGKMVPALNELLETLNKTQGFSGKAGAFFAWLGVSGEDRENIGKVVTETRAHLDALKASRDQLEKPSFSHSLNEAIFGDIKDLDVQIAATEKRYQALLAVQRTIALEGASKMGFTGDAKDLKGKNADVSFGGGAGEDSELARAIEHHNEMLRIRRDLEKELGPLDKELADAQRQLAEETRKAVAEEGRQADAHYRAAERILDELDPMRKYKQELEEIAELEQLGYFNSDKAERARAKVDEHLNAQYTVYGKLNNEIKQSDDFARQMGLTMESAFERAIVSGNGLRDVLRGILQDILKIATRKLVTEPLGNAVTSGLQGLFSGGGDAYSGISASTPLADGGGAIAALAAGGPADFGKSYLVGENGPELFTPGTSGTVSPNGAGGGHTFYIDARGADAAGMARLEATVREMNGTLEQRAVAAVGKTIRTNASYANLVRRGS